MNTRAQLLPQEGASKKLPTVRGWFILAVLSIAASIMWLAWPSKSGVSVVELSRADGKPRFQATSYSKADLSGLTLRQRLSYAWMDYRRRHAKPNPAASSFPARPVQPCSIQGLLSQCMEMSGTKYLIAVEVLGGAVDFGHTRQYGSR
jgi:hypothetical protein